MSKPPQWIPQAGAAVVVRAALIAVGCHLAGISLRQFALLHDGWEYLRLARSFTSWPPWGDLGPENLRLFPGYPMLIALVSPLAGLELAGMALAIVSAAACGPLVSRLGGDARLGWWMVALTPSWLLYTSTAMSEGPATLIVLLALLAMIQGRWVPAGVLVGFATLIRPVNALLMIPLAIETLRREGWPRLIRAAAVAAVPPVALLIFTHLARGNALANFRDYAEHTAPSWPLQSLVEQTLDPGESLAQKALVWGMVAVTFAAALGLWRRARGGEEAMWPLLGWHLAAALFYVLYPAPWLFGSLDRYLGGLWATTLIGLAPLIPRRPAMHVPPLIALSVLAWLAALSWIVNLSRVFPFADRAL